MIIAVYLAAGTSLFVDGLGRGCVGATIAAIIDIVAIPIKLMTGATVGVNVRAWGRTRTGICRIGHAVTIRIVIGEWIIQTGVFARVGFLVAHLAGRTRVAARDTT
jgi:hypothetical protein